jgi:uncharacterized protein (DUF58 family)
MMPAPRLLLLTAGVAVAAVAPAFWPTTLSPWRVAAGGAVLLALVDAWWAWRRPPPEVERRLPGSLALGVTENIRLRLRHAGVFHLHVEVYDHHPLGVEVSGLPQRVTLPPQRYTDVWYPARPVVRGALAFAPAQLRVRSPLGLWRRELRAGPAQSVRVYPNFAAVAKYTLLAADNRLSQMGIRKRRRRGEGQDFHQLREYRQGDPLRQVDWKASARLRKLISREYQEDRDQEIILMLDCGHRMLAQDGDLSHFDHSLNAILLLAYVALRQGDGVGFGSFSGHERWLKPIKGAARISHLFNTLYDLQPGSQAPDYSAAATRLLLRQKKRALVILITNLRDEDNADLLPAIQLLGQKHLVLVASMREQALDAALEQDVQDFDQALRHAATRDYLQQRRQAVDGLRAQGAHCIDVVPRELSVSLVNEYLDIKVSGRL